MHNIFTSNFKTQESQKIRQLILLNTFLGLATFSTLFFAIFNFYITKNMPITVINTLGFLIGIGTFLDLRFNQNLERAAKVVILSISLFFILFTYYNQNEGYGLFWTPVVAVFAVGLVGTRRSLYYLVPYFVSVFTLAYVGVGEWQEGQWSLLGFFRLVFSTTLITSIVMMMDLALVESYKNYEKLSSIDMLTNIYNRRMIQEEVDKEVEKAKRYNKKLGIILFDIDDFKKINDSKGHQAGDKALSKLSQKIQESLRSLDTFGRWGGEEFLIVIPQTTREEIPVIAEKLRRIIEETKCSVSDKLSCSFGVSLFENESDSADSLIEKADKAMYEAKAKGKNRVVFFDDIIQDL